MTLPLNHGDFVVDSSNSLWGGRSLHDLYKEAMTPWEWHGELFALARELGLMPFSTPFDQSSVDFLEGLDCPIYKIASFELVDLNLIRHAASTGKPIIISTGMGTISEIADAVDAARSEGSESITLLKTTSAYPASPAHSNLKSMVHLRETFGVDVGISDHTMGIGAAIAAVTLGATVVEKHLTIRRNDGGVDAEFSMEPEEFASMVREAEVARSSLGHVSFGPSDGDKSSLAFRRSLYVSAEVKAGDKVSSSNVRAIRPGFGLPIKNYGNVLNMRFTRDVASGTPLDFEMLK
jgi:N-acetylneuraminate synthase